MLKILCAFVKNNSSFPHFIVWRVPSLCSGNAAIYYAGRRPAAKKLPFSDGMKNGGRRKKAADFFPAYNIFETASLIIPNIQL